jgi:glycosyltransferase involved in cell wall biosynthesis
VKCSLFFPEWRIFGIRIPGFLRWYHWFLNHQLEMSPRKLYRRIVGKGYDVEIGFNRGAAARIIAASTSKTAQKQVWVHSDYVRCGSGMAGFKTMEEARRAYGTFDQIVCVSPQSERSFREFIGDFDTIITRSNVMDFDKIQAQAKQKAPAKTGKVLTAIGRVCEAKNYPMLLDAAAILKNKGVEFNLWIVGGGADMDALKAQKERLGLDNVTLWGAQENPYPYLAAADGYVCSSIYEGLSTTTIEALVLGKACVVTDCTGMRDILGDSEYGLVVPIDAEALAEGMEKLLTDANLRAHYEKMAVERAKFYAPERCIAEIEKLFN